MNNMWCKLLSEDSQRTCASIVVFLLYFPLGVYLQGLVLQLRTTSLLELCIILKKGAKSDDEEVFMTWTKSVSHDAAQPDKGLKQKVMIFIES